MSSSAHELIAACAYSLWEQAGRPSGRDLEFWTEAEAQLSATGQGAAQAMASVSAAVAPAAAPYAPREQAKAAPEAIGGISRKAVRSSRRRPA